MPTSPDTAASQGLYELGNQLRRDGQPREAERALKKAIATDPAFAPSYISLAYLHHYQGDRHAAAAVLHALLNRAQDDLLLQRQVASLLLDFGYTHEALGQYRALASRQQEDAGLQLALGRTLQTLGEQAAAAEAFELAVKLDANLGAAWLLLAQAQRGQQGLAVRYEAMLQGGLPLSKDTRICLHFGLGKIYDDLKDYRRAFENFQLGNAQWRAEHAFDPEAFADHTAALRRFFTAHPLPVSLAVNDLPRPVFIVGMLRSGTTLVERIIACHSRAYGLGETELADVLAQKAAATTGRAYPECLDALSGAERDMLAQQYVLQWPMPASRAACVVDKNPLNFLHVGLLASVFPQAKFVYCIRDRLDTSLSIYFQHFAHPRNSYAYDLDDIAFVYREHEELMRLWGSILPADRLYPLRYADLVGNPDKEIPALISWLGLDWEPACLSPHLHESTIQTASAWQARQPIYKASVGRAQNYRQYLSDDYAS